MYFYLTTFNIIYTMNYSGKKMPIYIFKPSPLEHTLSLHRNNIWSIVKYCKMCYNVSGHVNYSVNYTGHISLTQL